MASDAFSTIKKEAISLADFKRAIFSLNDVLMKSIWLGNNGETLSENLLENMTRTCVLIIFFSLSFLINTTSLCSKVRRPRNNVLRLVALPYSQSLFLHAL